MKLSSVLLLLLPVAALGSPVEAKRNDLTSQPVNQGRLNEGVANSETHEQLEGDVLTSNVPTDNNTDLAEPNSTQPAEERITQLHQDLINHITSYLGGRKDIIRFQSTCTSLYTTDKLKLLEIKRLKKFRFCNTYTNDKELIYHLVWGINDVSQINVGRTLEFARETERLLVGAIDLKTLLGEMMKYSTWRKHNLETQIEFAFWQQRFVHEDTYKTRLDKALEDYDDDWKMDDLVGMILVRGRTHDPEAFKDELRRKFLEFAKTFNFEKIVKEFWNPVDESHYWDDLVQALGTDLVEMRKIRKAARTARRTIAKEKKYLRAIYGLGLDYNDDERMSALMAEHLVERNGDEISSSYRQARETLNFQLAVQFNMRFSTLDIVKSSDRYMDPFFLRTLHRAIITDDVKIRDLLLEHRFLNMDKFKASWLEAFGEEYVVPNEEMGGSIVSKFFSYISQYFRRTY